MAGYSTSSYVRLNQSSHVCVNHLHLYWDIYDSLSPSLFPCFKREPVRRQQKVVWRSLQALPVVLQLFRCSSADISAGPEPRSPLGDPNETIYIRFRAHLWVTCVTLKVKWIIRSRFGINVWIEPFLWATSGWWIWIKRLIVLSCTSAEKMKTVPVAAPPPLPGRKEEPGWEMHPLVPNLGRAICSGEWERFIWEEE